MPKARKTNPREYLCYLTIDRHKAFIFGNRIRTFGTHQSAIIGTAKCIYLIIECASGQARFTCIHRVDNIEGKRRDHGNIVII
jgi:hypothetical protein